MQQQFIYWNKKFTLELAFKLVTWWSLSAFYMFFCLLRLIFVCLRQSRSTMFLGQLCDKTIFTKMAIYPLFTVHMLPPLHAFSNILDLIEAEQSIYQNVQYFIWSKKSVFFYFTAVWYSLHKCSERILWLKRQFTVHVSPVFCALEFMEARKTCYRVLRTSIWSIPYSGELCNKIVSSRLPRHWSSEARFVTLLGPINQMQLKRARPTAKKSGDGVYGT